MESTHGALEGKTYREDLRRSSDEEDSRGKLAWTTRREHSWRDTHKHPSLAAVPECSKVPTWLRETTMLLHGCFGQGLSLKFSSRSPRSRGTKSDLSPGVPPGACNPDITLKCLVLLSLVPSLSSPLSDSPNFPLSLSSCLHAPPSSCLLCMLPSLLLSTSDLRAQSSCFFPVHKPTPHSEAGQHRLPLGTLFP